VPERKRTAKNKRINQIVLRSVFCEPATEEDGSGGDCWSKDVGCGV